MPYNNYLNNITTRHKTTITHNTINPITKKFPILINVSFFFFQKGLNKFLLRFWNFIIILVRKIVFPWVPIVFSTPKISFPRIFVCPWSCKWRINSSITQNLPFLFSKRRPSQRFTIMSHRLVMKQRIPKKDERGEANFQ